MPYFAKLENDTVTRVIVAKESPGGAAWREASTDTRIGQIWDGASFTDAPRHPDRATALAEAKASVRRASDAAMAAVTENASPFEMATWPGKLAAAQAWDSGDTSALITEQLDAVGEPRGLDTEGAASLILSKATAFRSAAAAIEAVRVTGFAALDAVDTSQPLQAYIDALDAVVAAVDWPS